MSDQTQQPGTMTPSTATTPSSQGSPAPAGNPWQEADDLPSHEDNAGSGEGAETTTTPTTGQPPVPAAPLQPTLTPEAIAEIVSKATGQTLEATIRQQQVQQQQPQFTEQDFIKQFQVFQPTPELLASIGLPNTPETVEAFRGVSTAIVRQAVTMASFQMEQMKTQLMKQLQQDYGPAREFVNQQTEEKLKTEFLAENQDLVGFEPLLLEIRDRLISQGTKFTTKAEAFKTVAEHARQIIKQMPGLAAAGGQQQQQQKQSTPASSGSGSRMSALSGAGQGGVGGAAPSTSGGKKKGTAETLFGPR